VNFIELDIKFTNIYVNRAVSIIDISGILSVAFNFKYRDFVSALNLCMQTIFLIKSIISVGEVVNYNFELSNFDMSKKFPT